MADICHMWRYGDDLAPVWGSGGGGQNEMNGHGSSGTCDLQTTSFLVKSRILPRKGSACSSAR